MILLNVSGEVISIIIITLIISSVMIYIIKAKRKGVKCIGCPDAQTCSSKNLKKLCCEDLKKLKK